MNQDLSSYYNDRAKEYDKVYANPAEQDDLKTATAFFQNIFAQKTVLEIACGTGYWTEQISKTAASVFATDINESVIAIAKAKQMNDNATFEVADMFSLNTAIKYQGIFGGFIWSHILLQDMEQFLYKLKKLIVANGTIAFIDSNQVEGTNHDKRRITRMDEHGNTFQTRQLENGTRHEVLKNFPNADFLNKKLQSIATDIEFISLEHYWMVSCKANTK